MDIFSATIINFLSGVSPFVKLSFLALFSFAEGLPVIGSILPGGTIAILSGTLVEEGIFSPFSTILVIGVSSFLGDMTGFFIGKKFKHYKWVQKIANNQKHQKGWDLFDRHIAIIVIFGKLIPVVRSTPSIFAGIRGIKVRKYIFYSLFGSILWGFAGVYLGKFLKEYLGAKVIPLLFGIIILSILFVIIRPYFKFKKPTTSDF